MQVPEEEIRQVWQEGETPTEEHLRIAEDADEINKFRIVAAGDGSQLVDLDGDGNYDYRIGEDGSTSLWDKDKGGWNPVEGATIEFEVPEEEAEAIEEAAVAEESEEITEAEEVAVEEEAKPEVVHETYTEKVTDSLTNMIAEKGGDPYGDDFTETVKASRELLLDENNIHKDQAEILYEYLDSGGDEAVTWREAINDPELTFEHDGEEYKVKDLYADSTRNVPLYGEDGQPTEVNIVIEVEAPPEPVGVEAPVGTKPFEEDKVWEIEEIEDTDKDGVPEKVELAEDKGTLTWEENERLADEEVIYHDADHDDKADTAYLREGLLSDENDPSKGVVLDSPVAVSVDVSQEGFEVYKGQDDVWYADIDSNGTYDQLTDVSLKQDENGRWSVNYVVFEDEKKVYDAGKHEWITAPSHEEPGADWSEARAKLGEIELEPGQKSVSLEYGRAMEDVARSLSNNNGRPVEYNLLEIFKGNEEYFHSRSNPYFEAAEIVKGAIDEAGGSPNLASRVEGKPLVSWLYQAMKVVPAGRPFRLP